MENPGIEFQGKRVGELLMEKLENNG